MSSPVTDLHAVLQWYLPWWLAPELYWTLNKRIRSKVDRKECPHER